MGRILAAICGAVVVLGLMGLAPPTPVTPSPEEKAARAEQQKASADIAKSLEAVAATLKVVTEPSENGAPCGDPQQARNYDLCAQWKAADAAKNAADWTGRSFWIGALTLIAAGFAAYYARQAAKAGRDTLDAFSAVEDASLIIEFHETGEVVGSSGRFLIAKASVSNLGRSTARLHTFEDEDGIYRIDKAIRPDDTITLPGRVTINVDEDGFPEIWTGRFTYSTALGCGN